LSASLETYYEGVGSWDDNINNNNDSQPWGRKGSLPYTLACTANSRPDPTPNLTTKREKREEKDVSMANLYCGSHPVTDLEDSRSFAVANYPTIYLRSPPDPSMK
jgi:hypothetical protein